MEMVVEEVGERVAGKGFGKSGAREWDVTVTPHTNGVRIGCGTPKLVLQAKLACAQKGLSRWAYLLPLRLLDSLFSRLLSLPLEEAELLQLGPIQLALRLQGGNLGFLGSQLPDKSLPLLRLRLASSLRLGRGEELPGACATDCHLVLG